MKSSGIIFPKGQDKKNIEKTFSQENLSTRDFRVNSTPAPKDSPISGPAESEIENKQFNYDIQQANSMYYKAQSFNQDRNTYNNNRSVKNSRGKADNSNISKSFIQTSRESWPYRPGMKGSSKQTLRTSVRKPRVLNPRLFIIDHEKARLQEIEYKDKLKRIKGKNYKRTTKKKNKVVIKKSRKSLSNNKPSSKKTENKKRELKSQIEKGRKNESEKEESILSNIFSLNIFENVILRYVVAIISGVSIFGIIFSGLGLISP